MDSRLLQFAERNAPRYTSYPTAPHFTPAVGGTQMRQWLGALPETSGLSLYIHQPYCAEMCWYCGCHAFAAKRDEPLADFMSALSDEIALVAGATAARRVEEIHWGGGTPNLLSPARFSAIDALLRSRFDLSGCQRYAVEVDPRRLTRALAETYAACGVNRASLGVQDFDAEVQAAIGRVQPFELVAEAVQLLRASGVTALSFDLIYGLPKQTRASVERTVALALSLKPARLSVFGYAHVPWFKSRQKLIDASQLPGAAARVELAENMRRLLAEAGYVEIGYDHYALPDDPLARAKDAGALKRNFQGFVEGQSDALIGLGPSAISTLPQGYAQNSAEVGAWRAALANGEFATARGYALSQDDRRRRDLIMQLVCSFAANLDAYGGVSAFAQELDALAELEREGLVRIDGAQISIPPEARPLARLVAHAFDAFQGGPARHSVAV